MITPSFNLTATERVLPKLALDFTTASLDSRITFTRALATATVVNSSGDVATVSADTPRFDFNSVTLACKGLLIEEARTNILTYSEDFRNTADAGSTRPWAYTQVTVTPDVASIVAPDGSTNSDKMVENTAASTSHFLQATVTVANATVYSFSFFVKAGGRNRIFILMAQSTSPFTNHAQIDINLTTGAVVSSAIGSATVTPFKNGWYRVTVTGTATTSTGELLRISLLTDGGSGTYTGDGVSGVYLWGAQLEAGAFATSYIPTTTTALTRNADVATMTGTNFSSWFNASEGTFVASFNRYAATSGFPRVLSCSDNTASNEIALYIANATARAQLLVIDATVIQCNAYSTYSTNTLSLSGRYKLNSFAGSLDGAAPFTDSVGTVPVGLTQMTIGTGPATTSPTFSGHISSIQYWPQGLTNAEVQAIAK